MIRSPGRPRVLRRCRRLAAFTVGLGALLACGSAVAASTTRPAVPHYLFSVPTATGSLTGPNDHHLTLRLTRARDYLTRFTDRPLRQAAVVANVDFARRFHGYFTGSNPNAVLTYTPHGAQIPVSIVLTIGQPRWNAQHFTWTFPATRIRKKPDHLPGTTIHIKPPLIPTPRSFNHATLLIDTPNAPVVHGCVFQAYTQCPGLDLNAPTAPGWDLEGLTVNNANLSGADFTNDNLSQADLSFADLTGAHLAGASFFSGMLHGANFTNADLIGANLDAADLTNANLTGAKLNNATISAIGCGGNPAAPVTDLAGANLTNADLTGACISRANLAGANLTGANLAIRGNFNMIAFSEDTVFCHTTMPGGTVNNTGC
jgi:uncharacterized protein YjbI with pentapeptide repeats